MADLLRSPLHDRSVALGAKLADFGGWEMPI
jgi:aminomethyltransferase